MTEAEHNRPVPKFFGDRPWASAADVLSETIGLVIYFIYFKYSENSVFVRIPKLKEDWLKKS